MDELLNKIRNLINSHDFEKAETLLSESFKRFPNHEELPKLEAELRLRQGEFFWESGDAEKALDYFIEALEKEPENKEIVLRVGNILCELDQFDLARQVYESYLKKYPNDEEILDALDDIKESSELPSGEVIDIEGSDIKVSAIVSTYNSERFIRGCLEDLVNQTLYKTGKLEIIVIDSGSKQNERKIVKGFQRRYKNIRYIRTEKRETVYAAWNKGIKVARGEYLTNANTDDRHRQDALEVLCKALDDNPEVNLVYGDCCLSLIPNQIFEESPKDNVYKYPAYFAPACLLHFQFGPQPMWRKKVHEKIGYFDESFEAAGDYDFNIRFAFRFKALHVSEVLGTYLKHDKAVSFRDNSAVLEANRIHKEYRTMDNILDLYRISGISSETSEEKAKIFNDMGIRAMEFYPPWELGRRCSDFAFAIKCFTWASRFYPSWFVPFNNMAVVMFFCGMRDEAIKVLEDLRLEFDYGVIEENLRMMYNPLGLDLADLKLIPSGLFLPSQKEIYEDNILLSNIQDSQILREVLDESKSTSESLSLTKFGKETGEDGKKVLFVVHSFYTQNMAGTELYTFNLAKRLYSEGFSVHILYPNYEEGKPIGRFESEIDDGIHIIRMNIRYPSTIAEGFINKKIGDKFRDFLFHLKPDIVHFHHFLGFTISSLSSCVDMGIPTIVTLQDEWILCEQIFYLHNGRSFCNEGPENGEKCARCFVARHPNMDDEEIIGKLVNLFANRHKVLRKSIKKADKVFVPSRFLYEQLERHDFLNRDTSVMPLGIVDFEPLRKELHTDMINITYLGNIHFIKGLDVLIQAFNLVDFKNVCLNIYGNVQDYNYFDYVMNINVKRQQVRFYGQYKREELPLILSKADIVVVPSRSESYSFVVRECFHAGVPVIASNVGGIPEVVKNSENGLLFEPGDFIDLAAKLVNVITKPEMIDSFRKNIKPVRTISEDAKELGRLYSSIIGSKKIN